MKTHLLVETGRASRVAACAGPRSGFENGSEDIAAVDCDPCREVAPRAWSDGFGVWHVRVPANHPHPPSLAALMLRTEIEPRETRADPGVWEQPVRVPDLDEGETIVYREGPA